MKILKQFMQFLYMALKFTKYTQNHETCVSKKQILSIKLNYWKWEDHYY